MNLYRQHTNYLQKCSLCGRAGHDMYITTIEGMKIMVCSQEHAIQAQENYNTNKKSIQPEEVNPLTEPNQDPNYE